MLQCNQNGVTGKLVTRVMNYSLYDIWGKRSIDDAETFIFEIPADEVVFIKFARKKVN